MNTYIDTMRKAIYLSASFLLIGAISSCKKEGDLNPPFVENSSSAIFTDDVSVKTFVVRSDSTLADKITTGLVGTFRDSVFGEAKSKFYVQPVLPTNFLTFYEPGETFEVDSVVLSLQYSGMYGDTAAQTVEVRRVDEVLDIDENYYSNAIIAVESNLAGSSTFIPRVNQTVTINSPNASGGIDTLTLNPQIRIRLDQAIGNEILAKSGSSEIETSDNFVQFFKGLEVSSPVSFTPAVNEGAILYYGLTASNSKMSIFYQVSNTNDTVSRVVDFPINSSSVRFNNFSHDFTNSAVEQNLNNNTEDSLYTHTIAMAGVETKIVFDSLRARFKDQKVVVNKAELVLPIASGDYDQYGVATTLILAAKDNSGVLQFIPDFFEGESYFGGRYNIDTQSYTFNIARYIQSVINGSDTGNGLTLLVTGSAVKAERAALLGPENPIRKLKLNLYYSNTVN